MEFNFKNSTFVSILLIIVALIIGGLTAYYFCYKIQTIISPIMNQYQAAQAQLQEQLQQAQLQQAQIAAQQTARSTPPLPSLNNGNQSNVNNGNGNSGNGNGGNVPPKTNEELLKIGDEMFFVSKTPSDLAITYKSGKDHLQAHTTGGGDGGWTIAPSEVPFLVPVMLVDKDISKSNLESNEIRVTGDFSVLHAHLLDKNYKPVMKIQTDTNKVSIQDKGAVPNTISDDTFQKANGNTFVISSEADATAVGTRRLKITYNEKNVQTLNALNMNEVYYISFDLGGSPNKINKIEFRKI